MFKKMFPSRRLIILLTLSALGGLLLTALSACAPAKKTERVTVEMWIMPNSTEPVNDLEKVLAPFKKANPLITIKITSLDWGSAWTKITTAATSGDTPDIVQLGSTWVGSISAMGALLDVKDKVKDLGGADSFVPAAWASSGIVGSGQVTAIPWFVDARALFYRTDAFKRMGLSPKDIDTWPSFQNSFMKIKNARLKIEGRRVAPLGIPGKNDWNVIHSLAPWIWAAGGDFLTPDHKASALDQEAAFKGVSFYVDLVRQGLTPEESLELNTAQVSSNFNNGMYSAYFDGPYEIKTLTLPPERGGASESIAASNFAVTPYPSGPKGRFTFVGGSDLAIFQAARHKEEALEIVKFLVDNPAQVAYARATAFLPAKKAAFEDPYFSKDPHRKIFKEAVKYGRTYPCIGGWGLIEPVLTRRFGIMWDYVVGARQKYDPAKLKEQLELAAKEINSVLSQ